jgi:hypothetical protein
MKRKISDGTVSERGHEARDVMLGLYKTCRKLGLSLYHFIGDRLGIPGPKIPILATLVRSAPSRESTRAAREFAPVTLQEVATVEDHSSTRLRSSAACQRALRNVRALFGSDQVVGEQSQTGDDIWVFSDAGGKLGEDRVADVVAAVLDTPYRMPLII